MKYLVLWRMELALLSREMAQAVGRMGEYGSALEAEGTLISRYHVVGAHGGAWIYDVDSHEQFEQLLARSPVFNFARYDIYPLAEMAPRPEGEPMNENLVAARHALITQRLRQRRDDLGLTQKQIVTRLARCGLQTTNRALSSLEHGSGLDVAKLPELAVALDCTVTYLLGLTDDPHTWSPDERVELPVRRAQPAPPRTVPAPTPTPESLILGAFVPDRRPGPNGFGH